LINVGSFKFILGERLVLDEPTVAGVIKELGQGWEPARHDESLALHGCDGGEQ